MKRFIKGLFKTYVYVTSTVFTGIFVYSYIQSNKLNKQSKKVNDFMEGNKDIVDAMNEFGDFLKNFEK